jgi:hypothetical protein
LQEIKDRLPHADPQALRK